MKNILKKIQFLFFFACVLFFGYELFKEWDAFLIAFLDSNKLLLVFSAIVWPLTIFLNAWFSSQVLAGAGRSVSFLIFLSLYINRIPAKYLPGGIWHTVARAYDLNAMGVTKTQISTLVLYENIWSIFTASLISGLVIYKNQTNILYANIGLLMFIGAVSLILLGIFFRKREIIFPFRRYLILLSINLLFWFVSVLAFFSYLLSYDSLAAQPDYLLMVANYLFSYVIGFISIFAPQGIGVFESVMITLTEFSLPVRQILIILAGFRLVVLVGDMMTWCIYCCFKQRGK